MPNAVLEAMACGKAVIAAPVGGVLDVLEDGVNGRFTPVNDAEALAQEIEALLKDEQQRKQLGEQARKTIQTAFTPQRELEANLRIYNALVGK
jgi:glycosyltransferase involved in cell wall biosynthesis